MTVLDDGMGTMSVEAMKALPVPGHAKTSLLGKKTVPGQSRGGAGEEGGETSGSANETRLAAAGPPGHLPSSRLRCRGLPGVASASVQALKRLTETISTHDPTMMVKERGPPPPQDGVGAIIGVVERQDDTAVMQPDKGGAQQLVWQLGRQLGTGIVPGQGKRRSMQSFLLIF